MELQFTVEGSSGEEYLVAFKKENGDLRAFCSCAAAENGMVCKHRLAILAGMPDAVNLTSGNPEDAATVSEWLDGTELFAQLVEMDRLDQAASEATKRFKAHKKRLGKMMMQY